MNFKYPIQIWKLNFFKHKLGYSIWNIGIRRNIIRNTEKKTTQRQTQLQKEKIENAK